MNTNQYKMLALQQKRLKNNSVMVGGPGEAGTLSNQQSRIMQPPGINNIRDSIQSKQTQGNNYDHQRANSSLGLY